MTRAINPHAAGYKLIITKDQVMPLSTPIDQDQWYITELCGFFICVLVWWLKPLILTLLGCLTCQLNYWSVPASGIMIKGTNQREMRGRDVERNEWNASAF